MPTKKTLRKELVSHKMIDEATAGMGNQVQESPVKKSGPGNTRVLIGVLILLVLSAVVLSNKSMFVSAVVNGKPIFTWQLNTVMMNRYGKQTLEGMISEQLIAEAAQKAGVMVPPSEIKTKQDTILKGLGSNVSIDDLLKYQGITKADFDNQIRLQLTVQKLLGKDIVITDKDVENYITANKATLTASDPAQLQSEARQAILDAKVGEKLQAWFADLKSKAKIVRF